MLYIIFEAMKLREASAWHQRLHASCVMTMTEVSGELVSLKNLAAVQLAIKDCIQCICIVVSANGSFARRSGGHTYHAANYHLSQARSVTRGLSLK